MEGDQDTDLTIHMVTTHVVNHIGVVDNQLVTNSRIMLIDTNHMLPGDQVVTDVEKVDVVLEDVKVSSWYMSSTDKYKESSDLCQNLKYQH